jgi:hypothetical protein
VRKSLRGAADPWIAVRTVAGLREAPSLVHFRVLDGQVSAAVTGVDDVIFMFHPAEAMGLVAPIALDYPASDKPADRYALALALPQLDIAYLVDTAGQASTVELGPEPHDDPDTREDVFTGLHAILGADPYKQSPADRAATAFVALARPLAEQSSPTRLLRPAGVHPRTNPASRSQAVRCALRTSNPDHRLRSARLAHGTRDSPSST